MHSKLHCTRFNVILYIFSNKIPVLRDYIIIILLYYITFMALTIEWKHLHCVSSLLWFVWDTSVKYMIKQSYENPADCKNNQKVKIIVRHFHIYLFLTGIILALNSLVLISYISLKCLCYICTVRLAFSDPLNQVNGSSFYRLRDTNRWRDWMQRLREETPEKMLP